MKRIAVVTSITMVVLSSAAPAGAGWRPDKRAAVEYLQRRSGSVSFAVKGPGGRLYGYARDRTVPSASVLKVMFMVAYLRRGSVRDRRLTDDDRALLAPMIKRSDNDSATRIADMLGPRPMYRLARDARMHHFSYTRPWGDSRVSASDQARFMFHLERYIPRRHESYARYLLSQVVASQRWGIGEVERPNWRFFFKGGWGSGTGAVSHQVAFIQREGMRISAAVMITGSPSHGYSTDTLRGVFRRLLRDLPTPD